MLERLRNLCRKARFMPGFVDDGDGTVLGRPPTLSGLSLDEDLSLGSSKNSLRCASKVVCFVGNMVTLEVFSFPE